MSIDELIMKDLALYGQDNPCPKSLTVVEGKLWRHYELGAIYGFVAYNQIRPNGEEWFGIMSIEEDDEDWFIPSHSMCMALAWTKAVGETYTRMVDWVENHIIEGWNDDEHFGDPKYYRRELKTPLHPEEIPWGGEPDNAVLGTKYLHAEDNGGDIEGE